VGVVEVMPLSEAAVAERVVRAWVTGDGGSIVTANVDIVRAATRRPELAELITEAEVVVADGMPVVWAAALAGTPVPERVTGSSLVFSLSAAAAREGRSVYLLGGEPGVPESAAGTLAARFPGLVVAGTDSPPLGFHESEEGLGEVTRKVVAARPDLVFVGLGFPKQERVIRRLRDVLPHAWYLGCGAGIAMAAGEFTRAPDVVQKMGAEWVHRLALEPRRLARRYLRDDAPFALQLLAGALRSRITRTSSTRES
jgi:N-acetylglucosaminyldiphosphoundecaprenol N-acetyl-beta-D-mannosaminyltransferase